MPMFEGGSMRVLVVSMCGIIVIRSGKRGATQISRQTSKLRVVDVGFDELEEVICGKMEDFAFC